ncbi:hypothetical protein [Streptomyces griseoaurantiacus]|uniref:hypothetical protein n=1 Tax=Streptomyces griseoaurantiacus TaxID=68213 RepID=UPI00345F5F3C
MVVDSLLADSTVVLPVNVVVLTLPAVRVVVLAEVVPLSTCLIAVVRATLGRHRALRLLDSG